MFPQICVPICYDSIMEECEKEEKEYREIIKIVNKYKIFGGTVKGYKFHSEIDLPDFEDVY